MRDAHAGIVDSFATIGPSAHPCCHEVSETLAEEFRETRTPKVDVQWSMIAIATS